MILFVRLHTCKFPLNILIIPKITYEDLRQSRYFDFWEIRSTSTGLFYNYYHVSASNDTGRVWLKKFSESEKWQFMFSKVLFFSVIILIHLYYKGNVLDFGIDGISRRQMWGILWMFLDFMLQIPQFSHRAFVPGAWSTWKIIFSVSWVYFCAQFR